MLPNILVAESRDFPSEALTILRQCGEVVLRDLDRAALLEEVATATVLWVRLRHRIDAEVLAGAPHLQIVATPATGHNHVDVEELGRRGITLLSLRGEIDFLRDIRATAEHTIGLMLALLRHTPGALRHVLGGGWDRDVFKGGELYGRTVGIVGYGRLGRLVASYLLAFGARVLAADPAGDKRTVAPGVRLCGLPELLAESEVVTLHVNLNGETQSFFGPAQFAAMRPGSLLINTARGELLDEAALLHALRAGHLAGAALDVLVGENSSGMAHHPLVAHARENEHLLITPHLGGCTMESLTRTEVFLAAKVREALRTNFVAESR